MGMRVVPEFSRIFQLDKGSAASVNFRAKADAAELMALAKRFDLREIKNLTVEFTITRRREAGEYDLNGVGHADVVQVCVASLRDVPAHIDFSFHTKLVEGIEQPIDEADYSFLEEETDVDYYQNHQVDLGEIAAQYFSLELDPYPRSPEQNQEDKVDEKVVSEVIGPFAVLRKLKGDL